MTGAPDEPLHDVAGMLRASRMLYSVRAAALLRLSRKFCDNARH